MHQPASLSSPGVISIPVFENNIRKTTLQFVSCFCSNHQISTEEFGCLLLNLLESSGKFEFEIEFKGKHWIFCSSCNSIVRAYSYKIPYLIIFRKREENRVLLSNSRRDQIEIIHVRSQ